VARQSSPTAKLQMVCAKSRQLLATAMAMPPSSFSPIIVRLSFVCVCARSTFGTDCSRSRLTISLDSILVFDSRQLGWRADLVPIRQRCSLPREHHPQERVEHQVRCERGRWSDRHDHRVLCAAVHLHHQVRLTPSREPPCPLLGLFNISPIPLAMRCGCSLDAIRTACAPSGPVLVVLLLHLPHRRCLRSNVRAATVSCCPQDHHSSIDCRDRS